MSQKNPFSEFYRGDTIDKELIFKELNDDHEVVGRLDITDWTIRFTVKEDEDDDQVNAVIALSVTNHDDAANGETSIFVPKADTDGLSGTYVWDIEAEKPDGSVKTLGKDTIHFKKDVTN